MISFEDRLKAFHKAVVYAADYHGLIFVSGPGTAAIPAPEPAMAIGETNGQRRAVLLLAIAEQSPNQPEGE